MSETDERDYVARAEERIVVGTTRDLIASVADRWREQYPDGGPRSNPGAQRRLDALDPETATEDEVEAIIGNRSWTTITCDLCSLEVVLWARLGDEPDYDSSTVWACGDCLTTAVWKLNARASTGYAHTGVS